MAQYNRAESYHEDTPQRTSRHSHAAHAQQRHTRHSEARGESGLTNRTVSQDNYADEDNDATGHAETPDSRMTQAYSRDPMYRSADDVEEQSLPRSKGHAQSRMSNMARARARERNGAPKEMDITSELLQDTVI